MNHWDSFVFDMESTNGHEMFWGKIVPDKDFNTFSPVAILNLKSTMLAHLKTLWRLRSKTTPSRQLA
jgi:hypothetical protein